MVLVIFGLMTISILVISATDPACVIGNENNFFTPKVQNQLRRFLVGWVVFILFTSFDYNKLREWAWILYAIMILSLLGLFFVPTIQNVHRWYRVPLIGASIQPSEYAKLIVVISLSWFLERSRSTASSGRTALMGLLIVGIPFLLILKQPDLGTALVLCPITLAMFYLGNIHPKMVYFMLLTGALFLFVILLIFF